MLIVSNSLTADSKLEALLATSEQNLSTLWDQHHRLEETHQALQTDHETLEGTYKIVRTDYEALWGTHQALQIQHKALEGTHRALVDPEQQTSSKFQVPKAEIQAFERLRADDVQLRKETRSIKDELRQERANHEVLKDEYARTDVVKRIADNRVKELRAKNEALEENTRSADDWRERYLKMKQMLEISEAKSSEREHTCDLLQSE